MFYGELFQHVLVCCNASFRNAEDDSFQLFPIGLGAKKVVSYLTGDLCIFSEGELLVFTEHIGEGNSSEFIVDSGFYCSTIASL